MNETPEIEPGAERSVVPRKLFKIGEIMRYTGLSRQTIHNYTTLGLLREEERTESGHRLWAEEVFERIARIRELQKTRTLKEIIRILKADSSSAARSPRRRGGAPRPGARAEGRTGGGSTGKPAGASSGEAR